MNLWIYPDNRSARPPRWPWVNALAIMGHHARGMAAKAAKWRTNERRSPEMSPPLDTGIKSSTLRVSGRNAEWATLVMRCGHGCLLDTYADDARPAHTAIK